MAHPNCELVGVEPYHSFAFAIDIKLFQREMLRGKAYAEEFFDKEIHVTDTTEMVMNNEIYYALLQAGYRGGMLDGRPWVMEWREPTHLYSHGGRDLGLFCRHHELSDDVGYRFSNKTWAGYPAHMPTPTRRNLRKAWGDLVFIGWDFETFGEHHNVDTGIFEFMRAPAGTTDAERRAAACCPARPWTEFGAGHLPDLPLPEFGTTWAGSGGMEFFLGNASQQAIFRLMHSVLHKARLTGDADACSTWPSGCCSPTTCTSSSGPAAPARRPRSRPTSRPTNGGTWVRTASSPSSSASTPTSSGPWMPTSEPLHVAFVWHMHQPYYRSARIGGLRDALGAACTPSRTTWTWSSRSRPIPDSTRPSTWSPRWWSSLRTTPRATSSMSTGSTRSNPRPTSTRPSGPSCVERMCERPTIPGRGRIPRYLRAGAQAGGACSSRLGSMRRRLHRRRTPRSAGLVQPRLVRPPEPRDRAARASLVGKGRGFSEEDKQSSPKPRRDILARTLPAYREAARRGQIELSTSPYFHPILPLLPTPTPRASARPTTLLPPRRFAHPEDAAEQIRSALDEA